MIKKKLVSKSNSKNKCVLHNNLITTHCIQVCVFNGVKAEAKPHTHTVNNNPKNYVNFSNLYNLRRSF